MEQAKKFKGFSEDTIVFLKNLKINNNKQWFESHKQDYENFVLAPLKSLVSDLGGLMLSIDQDLEINPAVNKTISRIYCDTRFSREKAPYKTSHWITFKKPRKAWKDAPAYFFEIAPDSYRYGMGFYGATPDTMAKFRNLIAEKPEEFQKAISFYAKQKTFVLEGEKYKRVFDETQTREIQDWQQRKNLYLVCNRKIDDRLFSDKLVDDLVSGFSLLADFYHFLLKVNQRTL